MDSSMTPVRYESLTMRKIFPSLGGTRVEYMHVHHCGYAWHIISQETACEFWLSKIHTQDRVWGSPENLGISKGQFIHFFHVLIKTQWFELTIPSHLDASEVCIFSFSYSFEGVRIIEWGRFTREIKLNRGSSIFTVLGEFVDFFHDEALQRDKIARCMMEPTTSLRTRCLAPGWMCLSQPTSMSEIAWRERMSCLPRSRYLICWSPSIYWTFPWLSHRGSPWPFVFSSWSTKKNRCAHMYIHNDQWRRSMI